MNDINDFNTLIAVSKIIIYLAIRARALKAGILPATKHTEKLKDMML